MQNFGAEKPPFWDRFSDDDLFYLLLPKFCWKCVGSVVKLQIPVAALFTF